MSVSEVQMQRFSVTSSRAFDDVVSSLESNIGRPDMAAFRKSATAAKTFPELEEIVHKAVGPSDLMEFVRFDLGGILRKQSGSDSPRCLRLVAGNPLIMKKMVEQVHDAGSYAPVTILIDERADGVHLSYDRMASLLAPYDNADALKVDERHRR